MAVSAQSFHGTRVAEGVVVVVEQKRRSLWAGLSLSITVATSQLSGGGSFARVEGTCRGGWMDGDGRRAWSLATKAPVIVNINTIIGLSDII